MFPKSGGTVKKELKKGLEELFQNAFTSCKLANLFLKTVAV